MFKAWSSPACLSFCCFKFFALDRLVLPFERQLRGEEDKPLPPAKPRKQYKKSPDSKNSKAEGRKKRNQLEPESQLGAEVGCMIL